MALCCAQLERSEFALLACLILATSVAKLLPCTLARECTWAYSLLLPFACTLFWAEEEDIASLYSLLPEDRHSVVHDSLIIQKPTTETGLVHTKAQRQFAQPSKLCNATVTVLSLSESSNLSGALNSQWSQHGRVKKIWIQISTDHWRLAVSLWLPHLRYL